MRVVVLLIAGLMAWPAAARIDQMLPSPAGGTKKNPLLKLVEPWPSPEKMKERREQAEALPLFADASLLPVTLVADFKTINRDRDPASQQRYPAALRLVDNTELPVQLRARGHARRLARTCDYVPLGIEFAKKAGAATVFARQEALKLVVQCANGVDYEQYVLREYLAYRIYNLITRQSFRARLARVTYIDAASGTPVGTRVGMFLEDEADVARRLEGRVVDVEHRAFDDLDGDSLMPAMIFEYLIGNTDMSIYALHNIRLVQRQDKSLHVLPYDFDFSGLVNAPYARPPRGLNLGAVTDRLYRGPCRRQELVDPYVANFVAKKAAIRALPDDIPGLSRRSRDEARNYIDSFYGSIDSPGNVRRVFVTCSPKSTI